MLFALSGRRTDQPQRWALAPAVGLGVVGIALIALTPSDHVLGLLGWVWPPLLAILVVWSVRGARRSLHNWSRRGSSLPSLLRPGTRRDWRSLRDRRRGDDEQLALGGSHLSRRWPPSLPELRRLRISNGRAVQRPRRANANLGLGSTGGRSRDSRLHLRPCRSGLERRSAGAAGRTRTRHRPPRASLGCARPRPLRSCRSLRRWHVRPRLRAGLSKRNCRRRADRLCVPASVRPPVVSGLLFDVAPCWRAPSIAGARWNRPTHKRLELRWFA